MIFLPPPIGRQLGSRLRRLDALRAELGDASSAAGPWLGSLRRQSLADAVTSSVSIEGFVSESGTAIASGRAEPRTDDDNDLAVSCYSRAMDHVGVMASDPAFRWVDRVILDLHFDACHFQRAASPGRWRTGPVYLTGRRRGTIDYTGPDADLVPDLMQEVVEWLAVEDASDHVVVRAAMAHLNVVSVHPFSDGNGRVSRIVQSLVLARAGLVAPEFGSIEPYLAANTQAYYSVLKEVQGGSYAPERSAAAWVSFCVDAHIEQAEDRLTLLADAARRWSILERIVGEQRWPDRLVIALEQSLFDRATARGYRAEADVSVATATNDLRLLVDAGLLEPVGRGPARHYRPTGRLRSRLEP